MGQLVAPASTVSLRNPHLLPLACSFLPLYLASISQSTCFCPCHSFLFNFHFLLTCYRSVNKTKGIHWTCIDGLKMLNWAIFTARQVPFHLMWKQMHLVRDGMKTWILRQMLKLFGTRCDPRLPRLLRSNLMSPIEVPCMNRSVGLDADVMVAQTSNSLMYGENQPNATRLLSI